MNSEKFSISEDEQKKAKSESRGSASIEIYLDGELSQTFIPTEVSGYLSWTMLNGEWPTSIRIDYGHDLPTDRHEIDFTGRNLSYRDANGNEVYRPTSGTVNVTVDREGSTWEHHGDLDVTYSDATPTIRLKGTFEVSSKSR